MRRDFCSERLVRVRDQLFQALVLPPKPQVHDHLQNLTSNVQHRQEFEHELQDLAVLSMEQEKTVTYRLLFVQPEVVRVNADLDLSWT